MELKLIFVQSKSDGGGEVACASGACPTLYKTDRNTFVIQGFKVDDFKLELPTGETVIEVPNSFIEKMKEFI